MDTALFNETVSGAGSGTQRVTLPGTISLNGMTFLYVNPSAADVSNWRFEGTGPLNFTPLDPDIGSRISIGAANAVVEVAVPITGSTGNSISGGVRRSGTGTLILSGANTYTARTIIESGMVRLAGGNNRLPTGNVVWMTSSSGTTFIPGVLDLNGTSQTLRGIQDGNTGGSLVLTGTEVRLGGGTLTIDNSAGIIFEFSGAVTGAGNVVVNGDTGWVMKGANTYTGSTTVTGDLETEGGSNRLPQTTDVIIHAGGNLTIAGGANTGESVRSLSGSGGRVATVGGGAGVSTFTFGEGDTEPVRTFGGRIEGGGTVVKAGLGALVLTQSNNPGFSFQTHIRAGALVVNANYFSNDDFVVGTGTSTATLAGSGRVDAPVVVNATGRISPGQEPAPGSAAGALTIGSGGLNMSGGGTYLWQLTALSTANPGTNFDQVLVAGVPLVLGGTSKLTLDFGALPAAQRPDAATPNPFWSQPRQWTVLDYLAGPPSFEQFGSITNPNWSAGTFSLQLVSGDVILHFTPTPVPEPATVLGVAAGALGLVGFVRGRCAGRFRHRAAGRRGG
jgi:autotransporter-associated beta strand protein